MPELNFSQPERRSFLLPIGLALAAIAVAIAIAIHFFPPTTVHISQIHTDALPTETTLKGSTIVGLTEINHVLFVATTIKVDNQLRVPITLDDFHITLTDQTGAEMTVAATQPNELSDLETNYPALKPLMTTPLVRDTAVDHGKSAQGTVLFPLTVRKDVWDTRKSAIIKVDLYHQPAIYLTIPK